MNNQIQDEILDLAKKLILFKTTEDRPEELHRCTDFISEHLSPYMNVKKFCFKDKPSLIATFNKSKKQKVFFNAHIDVVPGADTQFQPFEKEGELFGRGSLDMKVALATFIVLMKQLSIKKNKPSIGLMVVSDEEVGGVHGTKMLLSKGYSCSLAIMGEPTQLNIKTKHKGSLQIKVKAYGKASHSARPWRGENAIEKIMKNYYGICSMLPIPPKTSKWKPTVSITNILGESPSNVIPTKAEMLLDVRTTEKFTNSMFFQILKELKLKYEVIFQKEMLKTSPRHKYVNYLKEIAENELKMKVKKIKGSGSTDGSYFSKKNIPAIIFGPVGKGHHTQKEIVKISSISPYYNILYKFIDKYFN